MAAARSSYEEGLFGMNSGSGPNASRDVARPSAKVGPKARKKTGGKKEGRA